MVTTSPRAICGAPAVIVAAELASGKPIRICADHLPPEARAVYDRLRMHGRALFEAHPHGQRVGRRIIIEFE